MKPPTVIQSDLEALVAAASDILDRHAPSAPDTELRTVTHPSFEVTAEVYADGYTRLEVHSPVVGPREQQGALHRRTSGGAAVVYLAMDITPDGKIDDIEPGNPKYNTDDPSDRTIKELGAAARFFTDAMTNSHLASHSTDTKAS